MVKSCTIPEVDWTFVEDYSKELKNKIEEEYINDISLVVKEQDPNIRSKSQKELLSTVTEKFNTDEIDLQKSIKSAFNSIVKEVVRKNVVEKGIRLDGRKPEDIRDLSAEINVLPRVHGSALFQRGETQVLNVTTLGMSRLEQMLDTIE